MTTYNEKVVKPYKMHYKGKEFTIGSLELDPMYEAILYRFMRCRRVDGDVDGITYTLIRSFSGIGDKKARGICEALVKQGVEITDIPESPTNEKPTTLVPNGPWDFMCSRCHEEITDNRSLSGKLYRFCPMCGKKLKVEG